MNRIAPFALLVSLTALLGCNPSEPARTPEAPPGEKTFRIAVIPKGTLHEFWKSIHAGAVKAEREINGSAGGARVKIEWKGPQKEDDRAQQVQVVQSFIGARVDGIALAPLDDTALLGPVRDAQRAQIPVVVFDSGLKGEAGKDFVAYVATDNYKGGEIGARRLGEILGGKGKVVLLRYQEGSESTTQRERGFLDALKKEFSGVEVLSDTLYGGATTEGAMTKSQNLITQFRDQLQGIFAPNESTTFGMLRALQDAGLAGKVKFVGFDASQALVAAMRKGEIHGLVLQNPVKMGYLAVKTTFAHLQGQPVEKLTDTGAVMVTPENMAEPEMKDLLTPDLAQWLGK